MATMNIPDQIAIAVEAPHVDIDLPDGRAYENDIPDENGIENAIHSSHDNERNKSLTRVACWALWCGIHFLLAMPPGIGASATFLDRWVASMFDLAAAVITLFSALALAILLLHRSGLLMAIPVVGTARWNIPDHIAFADGPPHVAMDIRYGDRANESSIRNAIHIPNEKGKFFLTRVACRIFGGSVHFLLAMSPGNGNKSTIFRYNVTPIFYLATTGVTLFSALALTTLLLHRSGARLSCEAHFRGIQMLLAIAVIHSMIAVIIAVVTSFSTAY